MQTYTGILQKSKLALETTQKLFASKMNPEFLRKIQNVHKCTSFNLFDVQHYFEALVIQQKLTVENFFHYFPASALKNIKIPEQFLLPVDDSNNSISYLGILLRQILDMSFSDLAASLGPQESKFSISYRALVFFMNLLQVHTTGIETSINVLEYLAYDKCPRLIKDILFDPEVIEFSTKEIGKYHTILIELPLAMYVNWVKDTPDILTHTNTSVALFPNKALLDRDLYFSEVLQLSGDELDAKLDLIEFALEKDCEVNLDSIFQQNTKQTSINGTWACKILPKILERPNLKKKYTEILCDYAITGNYYGNIFRRLRQGRKKPALADLPKHTGLVKNNYPISPELIWCSTIWNTVISRNTIPVHSDNLSRSLSWIYNIETDWLRSIPYERLLELTCLTENYAESHLARLDYSDNLIEILNDVVISLDL